MGNRFSEIASRVRDTTNAELDKELAQITTLSSADFDNLLPTKTDKEKFAKLMAIVEESTKRNNKIASIEDNITEFSEVILRILSRIS